MQIYYYVSESFRWTEYIVAGFIAIILIIAMWEGLIVMFGPEDKYDGSDPVIYDCASEDDFLEFLRDSGTCSEVYVKEELKKYRYFHSWRAKFDEMLNKAWFLLSIVIVTVAIVQIFKRYRRLKFREKFDNWLYTLTDKKKV